MNILKYEYHGKIIQLDKMEGSRPYFKVKWGDKSLAFIDFMEARNYFYSLISLADQEESSLIS